eukprot:CAMPEP_0117761266 /NCGR_PEP_ID=MMETSP0947-20121206/17175_1 /TAXON_ID=44440 /ORGANISM="Chattonella subsalsa, Strain CCMP2191" /LENGTH=254 /DNA_ID=CAMNT_0005582219 /DNA_START=97 /DNA_END=862 /DNA_ORIENTATION=+
MAQRNFRSKSRQDQADEFECPTPLFAAIQSNKGAQEISQKYLSRKKFELDKKNGSGNTVFHYAILNHNFDILKILMQSSSDLNYFEKENNDGCNILLLSAMENLQEAVSIICQHPDIPPHLINSRHPTTGQTALLWATIHGNISLFKVLIEYGASLGIKNKKGETSVLKAVECEHPALLNHILEDYPLAVDEPDKEGVTPLHKAVKENSRDCVRILLKYKADPTIEDITESSALTSAIDFQEKKYFKISSSILA